jgi:hypothetical protein
MALRSRAPGASSEKLRPTHRRSKSYDSPVLPQRPPPKPHRPPPRPNKPLPALPMVTIVDSPPVAPEVAVQNLSVGRRFLVPPPNAGPAPPDSRPRRSTFNIVGDANKNISAST